MPSSISSSEAPKHRAPAKNWLRIGLGTLLLAAGILGTAEAFWRSRGHQPSVVDDLHLWAHHRAQVSDAGPHHVVLLGASRIQVGFATEHFRNRFPHYNLTQLALDGRPPIATLRDLAHEPGFRGIVICDVTAAAFLREAWDAQQEYVNHYRQAYWPWHEMQVAFALAIQEHCVVVNPHVRLTSVLRSLVADGELPAPLYLTTRADRSRLADYRLTEIDERRSRRLRKGKSDKPKPVVDLDEWRADVAEIGRLIAQIESRGGKVILLRMPVTEEQFALEDRDFPRHQFWDRLSELTVADTLHFQDLELPDDLEIPDGSHLDYRSAVRFTETLLDELVRRGVLTETSRH